MLGFWLQPDRSPAAHDHWGRGRGREVQHRRRGVAAFGVSAHRFWGNERNAAAPMRQSECAFSSADQGPQDLDGGLGLRLCLAHSL